MIHFVFASLGYPLKRRQRKLIDNSWPWIT